MTTTVVIPEVKALSDAMKEHSRVTSSTIYSVDAEDIEMFLNERPALAEMLKGLDPEALACAIYDAIGEIGILEMVEDAVRNTILAAAARTEAKE